MTLSWDKEFAAAMAPLAAALSSAPKLSVGDVAGRRAFAEPLLTKLIDSIPDSPDVASEIQHVAGPDGHQIPVYRFWKKKTNTSSSSPSSNDTSSDPAAAAATNSGKGEPAFLHTHGGGMILGHVSLFAKQIALMVSLTGIQHFSVDYRLAPEHPYPTAVEESYAALLWLHANATTFNIDRARIGITGESAGGLLAAATALLARDRGLAPPLAKQVLVYPMLDDRNTGRHEDIAGLVFGWGPDDNLTGWRALLGEDKAGKAEVDVEAYGAPARAKTLKGLPDTYVDVGQLDILLREDMEYVGRLASEGVPVEFHLYPGVPHGFEGIIPHAGVTRRAMENRVRAMTSF